MERTRQVDLGDQRAAEQAGTLGEPRGLGRRLRGRRADVLARRGAEAASVANDVLHGDWASIYMLSAMQATPDIVAVTDRS